MVYNQDYQKNCFPGKAEKIMPKRSFIPILIALSVMFILSAYPVSAQETDIDSMTDEQLMLLLQAIMQKLEDDESDAGTAEIPGAGTAAGPVAVNDAETGPESKLFRAYGNKKLIVEALPEYMFIRPTEVPRPEKKDEKPAKVGPGKKEDSGGPEPCRVGEQCVPDDWYCRWELTPEGRCACMCG